MSSKKLICICGPTASGKTSVGIELAKHFNTEIISADSRQVYKELTIGTAVPTTDELTSVRHHFIHSHSIYEGLTAGEYAKQAHLLLIELFKTHDIIILVGGSGLFVKALTEGFDRPKAYDQQLRENLSSLLENEGIEGIRKRYLKLDPNNSALIDMSNPQRLIRAIELHVSDQKGLDDFEKAEFETIGFVLNWNRSELYRRIEMRVDQMINDGLVAEADRLFQYKDLNALQTVGYSELFKTFNGELGKEKAIELIKRNTRRYAKRQMTWFRNQSDFTWVEQPFTENIIKFINT